jgi:saccharopine dehydrogenase (NADP+, L-glutamate forming)
VDIGFLKDEEQSYFKEALPWKEATQKLLSAPSSEEKDLVDAITAKTTFKDDQQRDLILSGLKWLGLFSSEQTIPRGNPLDTICATLEKKMQYGEGERDLVV